MTVSRCLLPFANRLGKTAMAGPAIKELLAEQPEVCPHSDCSPGANCRGVCRDFAAGEWVKWNRRKG